MKRFVASVVTVMTGLILAEAGLHAEPPIYGGDPTNSASLSPSAAPAIMSPSTPSAPVTPSTDLTMACPQLHKICVCEPKHNTKTIYACKCEEYCLPRCSFFSLFRGKCDCDNGHCGDVRIRHRLVVKKVEDRDTKQCVVREVPLSCPFPAATGK